MIGAIRKADKSDAEWKARREAWLRQLRRKERDIVVGIGMLQRELDVVRKNITWLDDSLAVSKE